MSERQATNTIARERVEDLSLKRSEPTGLKSIRLSAWESYLQRPMPAAHDEHWRRTDLSGLDLSAIKTLDLTALEGRVESRPEAFRSLVERLQPTAGQLCQLTDAPGYLDLDSDLSARGVVFTDLQTALSSQAEKILPHLDRANSSAQGKFELLNSALFNCGLFLYVPEGVELALPFVSWIDMQSCGALFPRMVVVAEANSKVTLISAITGGTANGSSETSLCSGLVQIHVGQNAQVSYLELQHFAGNVFSLNKNYNEVQKDGRLVSLTAAVGGWQTKSDIATYLKAPGASSEVLGVILGSGNEHYNFNTIQEHQSTDTTSDINFRVALKESSSSTYQGIIRVDKVAQRTNAYQSNKNLLLGSEARADSIPKLEILADDVRCSHGATVGPVDKEQIFYLTSRGLTPAQAEELIVLGFFRQVLERFPLAAASDWLADAVVQNIYKQPAVFAEVEAHDR